MKITLPEFSLVALVGISGSGKTSFGKKHFKSTELISSDHCRGLVSDNENDQSATNEAFELLYFIANKRLAAKKLTVIDATNIQTESRKSILELARKYHCFPVAIVFNIDEKICRARNKERSDRDLSKRQYDNQRNQLKKSLTKLKKEGFRYIYVLNSVEDIDCVEIERQPIWTNKRNEEGPFDIIGDIHGCYDELCSLLEKLGYKIHEDLISTDQCAVTHPEGRRVILLGDLVDRGPKTPEVLALVMNMVYSGTALCLPGNHEEKLKKYLKGNKVRLTHGLAMSVEQLEKQTTEFRGQVFTFLDNLISHYELDEGKLVTAHAGMKESMQGRASGKVRSFALYGETTGETDEFGLPVRYNWASQYRGRSLVVYGHTPVQEIEWLNNTVCIDTGCVFGGKLTALRYPEREIVSVRAVKTYYEPIKPLGQNINETHPLSLQQEHDDLLDINDVLGKKIVSTRLRGNITIREKNSRVALETISRFAVNPKWLIYLPPTMSPSETSNEEGFLEHPEEAFNYYKNNGIQKVVCQKKHMGSRVVIVLCRNEKTAIERFGIINEGIGICYTRTGRSFFDDKILEKELLARIALTLEKSNFWKQFETDWVCLDCEIMPWSFKSEKLLKKQYAAVGSAGRQFISDALKSLNQAEVLGQDVGLIVERFKSKETALNAYVDSYRNYCWPFNDINDLRVAPFHILATEGCVHFDKNHQWHMQTLKEICPAFDPILMKTSYRVLSLESSSEINEAISWWTDLTEAGYEGMIVKPFNFIGQGKRGLLQPAIKCRGKEYLRIIYGPEYLLPENMNRLRKRNLSTKRSQALRQFSLGLEALERFVRREPLRKVHECVFAITALEGEEVDPRL